MVSFSQFKSKEGALASVEQKAPSLLCKGRCLQGRRRDFVLILLTKNYKVENRHLPVFFLCAFLIASDISAVRKYGYANPQNSYFVSGNPYRRDCPSHFLHLLLSLLIKFGAYCLGKPISAPYLFAKNRKTIIKQGNLCVLHKFSWGGNLSHFTIETKTNLW